MKAFTDIQIKEIAEQLDCGFRCFWHKETNELLFVPDTLQHPEMDNEIFQEDLEKIDENFSEYVEIVAMTSSESFQIMIDFAEQLTDCNPLKDELIKALNHKKPFRHFKFVIDNSGIYRQQWFDFKDHRQQEWVREKIEKIARYDERNSNSGH